MLYRENGQFKTTYRADQQIFPIVQDRYVIGALLAFAFAVVPWIAPEYLFRAILIPFVILSLAAIGLNILVGYCGQISLGTGAFMAVGAYAAYNFQARIEGLPLLVSLLLGGLCATAVGVVFGVPSLRIKGLTDYSASGSVSVSNLQIFGVPIETPAQKYLFCLAVVTVFALMAKN